MNKEDKGEKILAEFYRCIDLAKQKYLETQIMDRYIEFTKIKHGDQKRSQGTPYYLHPVAVAKILERKGFPIEYQIVGLFHDLLEDTNTTREEICLISNAEIATAVKILTKEKGYNMKYYIEEIKKHDITLNVKLADRMHNLSEAHLTNAKFQKKYIDETKEWYVDLSKGTKFEEDIMRELRLLEQNYLLVQHMSDTSR